MHLDLSPQLLQIDQFSIVTLLQIHEQLARVTLSQIVLD